MVMLIVVWVKLLRVCRTGEGHHKCCPSVWRTCDGVANGSGYPDVGEDMMV